MRKFLLAPVFVILAAPALASDGVLEINQTCAVQTGCFAGDTAGFPVTIDGAAGKSYRLTSDLLLPDENTTGIQIGVSDVGIDLNNFTIEGPVVCSGSPLVCAPAPGSGSGVDRLLPSNRGLSVKNGSITGMGSYGVLLGEQAEATNLRARSNGIDGINVSTGSTVSGNTARLNGDDGIAVSLGSTVSDNTVYQNGDDGIATGFGSTVSGNTAYLNGDDGISVALGSTVSNNTTYDNEGDGIQTSAGCLVRGNTARLNTGLGLNLGAESGYRENVLSSNSGGTVTGGVDAGANVINGVVSPTP